MDEFEKFTDKMISDDDTPKDNAAEETAAETVDGSEEPATSEAIIQESVIGAPEAEPEAETGDFAVSADYNEDLQISDSEVQPLEEPAKKPFVLQKTIIIATSIFLAALVVFGCFIVIGNIMHPGVEGVWRLNKVYMKGSEKDAQKVGSSAIEAAYYQFAPEGEFIYRSGTVTQKSKWSYIDENGKATDNKSEKISLYADGKAEDGTMFTWSIDGDKLKLQTGTDAVQVYDFSRYEGSEMPEYKMKADKDFKAVSELIGNWDDKATQQQINLKKDGTYVLTVQGTLTQKGTYSADSKKKTLKLRYVSGGVESDTGDLPYEVKGNKMTLASYEFTKK